MKYFLSFLAFLPTLLFAQDISWYNSSNDSFKISTAEQLKGLAKLVNEGIANFNRKTITLEGDIVLTGSWVPIGVDKTFAGTFEGDHHSISGLSVEGTEIAGLFGSIRGTVSNLIINASKIKGTSCAGVLACNISGDIDNVIAFADSIIVTSNTSYTLIAAGGLVGKAVSNAVGISRSYATGNVVIIGGRGNRAVAGGLVGFAYCRIKNSYATGNVVVKTSYEGSDEVAGGGLVGRTYSQEIKSSYATGNVMVSNSSEEKSSSLIYAGGLVGYSNDGGIGGLNISMSYATGNVTSEANNGNAYAGGLVGEHSNESISNSYAMGNVVSEANKGEAYAGGLCTGNSTHINNSYAIGNVAAYGENSRAGGISTAFATLSSVYYNSAGASSALGNGESDVYAKSIIDLQKKATFAGWDFYDTWDILQGSTTPFLYDSPKQLNLKHFNELTIDIDYSTVVLPTLIIKDGSKTLSLYTDYSILYDFNNDDYTYKGAKVTPGSSLYFYVGSIYIGSRYVEFSNPSTAIPTQAASGNILVKTAGNSIVLENLPSHAKVQIYNLQGKQIYSAYPGNPKILKIGVQTKGIYVVKAGSQSVRVVVR